MQCTSPRTVGYQADGKTLSWTPKNRNKELSEFKLPCGKCLACRLEYARQWAIRCIHEAQMHENNSFITLTFSDEYVGDNKLRYEQFQAFMKRLRKTQDEPVGFFATGEYGEKTQRQHWHALLFNWRPRDATYSRSNERGDRIFTSATLDSLWGLGRTEIGDVTFESAGYCARYAAKKLVHGFDQQHEFHPISKKSNKHAIGKKWLEKYWPDVFTQGHIVLHDGTTTAIPRYYEKWFKENRPEDYFRYVTQVKIQKTERASTQASAEIRESFDRNTARRLQNNFENETTRTEAKKEILKSRFETLQKNLKL